LFKYVVVSDISRCL